MAQRFHQIVALMGIGVALAGCLPSTPAATDAAAQAGPADSCKLAFGTSVPLGITPHHEKFFIPVTMEGTPLTMILDTGSEGIVLTRDAARRASHAVAIGSLIGGEDDDQRRGFSTGIGGSREVGYLAIRRLDIGRLHGAFSASVMDEDLVEDGQHFDGLIGMAALGNFDIDLDVPGRELRLYTTSGTCSSPAVALDEPIYAMPLFAGFRSTSHEMIDVQINGQTLRALIDSGSPSTLIYGPAAARLGLSATESDTGKLIAGVGVGGKVMMARHRLDAITVGPITFRHVFVYVDPEGSPHDDMLLGQDFLEKVHVWFSNSSHMLVMQYPPKPSPPLSIGQN